MASSSNSFLPEGISINRPPIFNGDAYAYWKIRMKIFIEAIDLDIWEAIENGPLIPSKIIDGKSVEKPKNEWSDEEKKRVQCNLKAKNIIMSALGHDEFFRVSNCTSAQDMWNTLQVTHEGTSEVKRSRINTLTHEYELFTMHQNENIQDMQKRFTHIVNHLSSLGKVFQNEDLINKVLRCLNRQWQPKVTAISESKDLTTMSLATLFGKLQEHELELNRLSQHEENDKKKKGIALKASSSTLDEKDDPTELEREEVNDESFSLLVKKFGRFLKKGNQRRSPFTPKKNFKKGENSSSIQRCFECNEPGHMKMECPIYLKKMEKLGKRPFKDNKGKRAYITWEDNDVESSSDSDDEGVDFGLMARDDESDSDGEVSSSNSDLSPLFEDLSPSFDELQDAFNDLHEESMRLSKLVASSKKRISTLEKELSILSKKLEELKIENETLGLIDANSSCEKCLLLEKETSPLNCSSCEKYKKENIDLKETLSKFTFGKKNLEILLGNQRCAFDKAGLGFNPKGQQKFYKDLFPSSSITSSSVIICFHCGKKGHVASTCSIRRNRHGSGNMMWVPKGTLPKTNIQGPKKIWVPKSKV